MEIGYPTDVKHVAHIGWDGSSGSAPSWMNEFKPGPNFSSASFANPIDSSSLSLSTWSSQEFEQTLGQQSVSEMFKDVQRTDPPTPPKKQRRRKKSSSSPGYSSSSRSSRSSKPKFAVNEGEATENRQTQKW